MKKDVLNPEFWTKRLERWGTTENLHASVYNMPKPIWDNVQTEHSKILNKHLYDGMLLLDAGCAYGALVDILPKINIDYLGVDLCLDFILKARELHPSRNFGVSDLRALPFQNKQFDICIGRSIEGPIKENVSEKIWIQVLNELYRVSQRVLLLSYGEPTLENWCK